MATLRNALTTKYDPRTGGLVQSSGPQSLRQAATNQELPVTPSDPLSAARTQGVTPQMAAMSPYANTEIKQKARDQLNKATNLKSALQDFSVKADKLINPDTSNALTAGSQYKLDDKGLEAKFPATASAEQRKKATEALAAIATAAAPTDQQWAAAASALFAAGINDSPSTFLAKQETTAVAAQLTPDQIYGTPDVLAKIGVTPEELNLLGIPPEQAATTTIAEIQRRVQETIETQFREINAPRLAAQDAALGRQVREQMGTEAAAMGAAGSGVAASTTMDTARLADDAAQPVVLGGKEYSIEDLLKDDTISDIINQYLVAPADSQLKKDMQKQLGPLAEFADKHAAILTEAGKLIDTAKTGAETKWGAKKQVMDTLLASTGLGEAEVYDIFSAIYPEMKDKFSLEGIDPAKSGLAQVILDPSKYNIDPGLLRMRAPKVKELLALDPKFAKELAGMSPDQISRLGIFSQDTSKFDNFVKTLKVTKAITNQDYETVVKELFGLAPNELDAIATSQEIIGDKKDFRDNRVSQLQEYTKTGQTPSWMTDALRGPATLTEAITKDFSPNIVKPIEKDTIASALEDGNIDKSEAFEIISKVSDKGTLERLLKQPMSSEARDLIKTPYNKLVAEEGETRRKAEQQHKEWLDKVAADKAAKKADLQAKLAKATSDRAMYSLKNKTTTTDPKTGKMVNTYEYRKLVDDEKYLRDQIAAL